MKISGIKCRQQRDMVKARGFHSDKGSVLGIKFEGVNATGGEGVFGDVNTDKDVFHGFFTSFLVFLGIQGRGYASRPILHDDKGLKSPTHKKRMDWEQGTDSLKGFMA